MISLSEPVREFSERMRGSWRIFPFEDLLLEPVRNGIYKTKEFHGSGAKVVNMGELFAYEFISSQEMKRVEITPKEEISCTLKEGDLLFARRSLVLEGAGKCSVVGKITEPTTFESSIIRARPDQQKVVPRFLYYLFASPLGRAAVASIATRTAVSGIRGSELSKLALPFPDLPTQRKIAETLSAYDDLIENNLRRIKILEEMAQSLYREWFVHFRFPGNESTKFVDSELGQIPKGWGVSDLEKVTTKIGSGATPRGGKDSYKTDGITLIRSMNIYDYSFEFDSLAFIDPKQAAQLDNVSVEAHDVLLNITGASVCRCAMVPSYLLPARVNQHVAIIRANTELVDPHFLLDSINSEQNKKTFFSLAQGGATREALTKETICRFQILLPPRDLVFRYGRVAGAMHTQREGLQRKNQTLRRTRDLLLPKLLQGQH